MYRCVIVGLLLDLHVCHGKTKKANRKEQAFSRELCCLTRLKGLCNINSKLEMKVHEVWWLVAGVGKHLVPSPLR